MAPVILRGKSCFCAWMLAVQVILLGAAAQNPALHAWLHNTAATQDSPGCHHEDEPDGPLAPHECAVTLFAAGVSFELPPPLVTPPVLAAAPAIDELPQLQLVKRLVARVARDPPGLLT